MDSFLYLLFVFVFVFLIFFLWIRIILYPVPVLRSTFGQTWLRDEELPDSEVVGNRQLNLNG